MENQKAHRTKMGRARRSHQTRAQKSGKEPDERKQKQGGVWEAPSYGKTLSVGSETEVRQMFWAETRPDNDNSPYLSAPMCSGHFTCTASHGTQSLPRGPRGNLLSTDTWETCLSDLLRVIPAARGWSREALLAPYARLQVGLVSNSVAL